MTQPTKNTLLVVAMVAGALSLPMTWMTIQGAQMQGGGPLGEMFNSSFRNISLDVTGLNGHVTLLVKLPIWFIIALAIGGSGLQLMDGTRVFAVPATLHWVIGSVSFLWVLFAVLMGLFSSSATLGAGALIGLFSAAVPLGTLIASTTDHEPKRTDSDPRTESDPRTDSDSAPPTTEA